MLRLAMCLFLVQIASGYFYFIEGGGQSANLSIAIGCFGFCFCTIKLLRTNNKSGQ